MRKTSISVVSWTKNVAEILTKLAEETGLPKTTAVERAIKAYYDHFKKTGKI